LVNTLGVGVVVGLGVAVLGLGESPEWGERGTYWPAVAEVAQRVVCEALECGLATLLRENLRSLNGPLAMFLFRNAEKNFKTTSVATDHTLC
jgi:hypothetical protein